MKIICSGPNYLNHFTGKNLPLEPQFFIKTANTICKNEDRIILPHYANYLLVEVELALVIGKDCYYINENEAQNYVSHYTIANDVTAVETATTDMQWLRAKCANNFCPTANFISGYPSKAFQLKTFVNGFEKQNFTTEEMLFKPQYLVSYLSKFMTLHKGDVILTGSKKGAPKVFKGDIVRIELDNRIFCENIID